MYVIILEIDPLFLNIVDFSFLKLREEYYKAYEFYLATYK